MFNNNVVRVPRGSLANGVALRADRYALHRCILGAATRLPRVMRT